MDALKKKKFTLRTRFILSFVFVIIVTITILSITNHLRWYRNYLQQIEDQGLILVQTLAHGGIDPIIKHDYFTLNDLVKTLLQKENIVYVIFTDKHNRVLAQSEKGIQAIPENIILNPWENTDLTQIQTYLHPQLNIKVNDILAYSMVDNTKWGAVRVGFSLEFINEEIYKNVSIILIISLISIVIGVVVAMVLIRFVTGPIEQFVKSMEIIAKGDLEQKIQMNTSDEFGGLAMAFNHMSLSLKQSKEELKETYQQLLQKEKMAALGKLTARIAHEIKNPLSIIKGSAQILIDKKTKPEIQIEVGQYIFEEVNRLSEKIGKLLTHAKPIAADMQPVNVNQILEEVAGFWESQRHAKKKVVLIRKFDEQLPLLLIDAEQIRQVALNMIINSCEAMPDIGKITIETKLEMHQELAENETERLDNLKEHIVIRFRDTGVGIVAEHVEKIFEPFFTTKEHGTGLGLSNVYRIVNNNGGKIEVRSGCDSGTEFIIYLPTIGMGVSK